ncbi:MAG: cation-efflux pump, partial [Clostridia bacterium]|nr:cation-efflux pump [Clostridia bacterium]
AVIHMDPIRANDEETNLLRASIAKALPRVGEDVTLHDFRRVVGPTHTNLIFDVVVPYDTKRNDAELRAAVDEIVAELGDTYRAVVSIDRPFVER